MVGAHVVLGESSGNAVQRLKSPRELFESINMLRYVLDGESKVSMKWIDQPVQCCIEITDPPTGNLAHVRQECLIWMVACEPDFVNSIFLELTMRRRVQPWVAFRPAITQRLPANCKV